MQPRAWVALMQHSFPGNVRELAHFIEKIVLLGQATEIGVAQVTEFIATDEDVHALEFRGRVLPVKELERRYASWALAQMGGHRTRTAEKLGVDPKTLRKWLEEEER